MRLEIRQRRVEVLRHADQPSGAARLDLSPEKPERGPPLNLPSDPQIARWCRQARNWGLYLRLAEASPILMPGSDFPLSATPASAPRPEFPGIRH